MGASEVALFAAAAVVGLASGTLSGMFGIGGAVVSTPAVRLLGASPIDAVGSTVPAILPAAVAGTIQYTKAGLVDFRVALACGITGSGTALLGAWVADLSDARWLMVATALLVGRSGWQLLARTGSGVDPAAVGGDGEGGDWEGGDGDGDDPTADVETRDGGQRAASADDPHATCPGPTRAASWLLVVLGGVAGFLAGLLGVGGGIVLLPAFTTILGLQPKKAVASSLVAVAAMSVPSLAGHWWLGHIDWRYASGLIAGVVPGARLGAAVTLGRSEQQVRRWLGFFFVAVAFVYGGAELLAIFS
ncbi:MAG: hypothetical protein KatS3mg008_1771 [Acidimicrobiales bacterium]|nr:MAG: hypothetical protein KatS3mg008_1771 [Acidimicrobiales bacterium]